MDIKHIEFGALKINHCIFINKANNHQTNLKKIFIVCGLSTREINSINVCRNLIKIIKNTKFNNLLNYELHIFPFTNLFSSHEFIFNESKIPYDPISYPQLFFDDLSIDAKDFINFFLIKFDAGIFLLDSYSNYNHLPFFYDYNGNTINQDNFIPNLLKNKFFVNNLCISINSINAFFKATKPIINLIKNLLLDLNNFDTDMNFLNLKKYDKYKVSLLKDIKANFDGFWFPNFVDNLSTKNKNSSIAGFIYNTLDFKNYPIKIKKNSKCMAFLLPKFVKQNEILFIYKNSIKNV